MGFQFQSKLDELDSSLWSRYYPNGLGGSAFSALAWQRMMEREMGDDWRLRLLRSPSKTKNLSLPVFVRENRFHRHQITIAPLPYYVTPLEYDTMDADGVHDTLSAVSTLRTSMFTWWLPPWSSWKPTLLDKSAFWGCVTQDQTDTYVLELDESYEDFLAKKVSSMHVRHIRSSLKRGLEIIPRPTADQIDQYYALYLRVRVEEGWVDKPFSRQFFHDAGTTLEEGGNLIVMQFENRIVGGGVLLYDRKAVHYFQGTTDRQAKTVFPHAVLYSEAIRHAIARGLKYVNLGGVNDGNEGLIQFKKSWGAKPMPVPYLQWRCTIGQAIWHVLTFSR